VLVKIAYSGICHSQLNEIRGLKGEDKFLPHVLGHEGSGTVEAIGPGVKKVEVGDRVVLSWIKGNGFDVPVTLYKRKDGTIVNSGAVATFMTKAVISENRLVRIPDAIPLREAALLGCAIPTGAGVVINTARLTKGSSVAIFGVGGIGLSALLAAKLKQVSVIIAVDIFEKKLDRALELGATHAINAKRKNSLTEILNITNKQGVDCAIECAGVKESMETAFQSVREKGGLCIIAGNLPCGQKIQIDPFDLIKGKCIMGTWGGQTRLDQDIPVYADWILSGKLDLKKMICRVYKLKDINRAIAYMGERSAGRVLIEL